MKTTTIIKSENARLADKDEIAIVQELANDKTLKEIAKAFGVNKRYVENRLEKMRIKYNCTTSKGLITLFFRNKLIE